MSESTIDGSVRYVVRGEHPGAILPGKRAEMWRDIYLFPGAVVGGGIMGNQLEIEGGGARVMGSIFTRGSIQIIAAPTSTPPEPVRFDSVACAGQTIITREPFSARVSFLADVFAEQVNLSNALIRGNLYARRATLRNCVVMGGVFCQGHLVLQNVILSTFRAASVEVQPELMLFFPFAIAEQPIQLDFSAKCLSFTNLLRLDQVELDQQAVVSMDAKDVVEVREPEDPACSPFYMLSLGSRILDLNQVKRQFEENLRFIKTLSLGDHLSQTAKSTFENLDLARVESLLFSLLANPPKGDLERSAPLSTIEDREEILQFIKNIISGTNS